MIDAGWIVTGSWPIDTEHGGRLRATDRPHWHHPSILSVVPERIRMDRSGTDDVGDWRDILRELPNEFTNGCRGWPRRRRRGGCNLRVSRARAWKFSPATAAWRKPAASRSTRRIPGARLGGRFERGPLDDLRTPTPPASSPTLGSRPCGSGRWGRQRHGRQRDQSTDRGRERRTNDEEDERRKSRRRRGYVLEFDAARKIAQGLGIHLEKSRASSR